MYKTKSKFKTFIKSLLISLVILGAVSVGSFPQATTKIEASEVNSIVASGYTHTGQAHAGDGTWAWYDRQDIAIPIVDGNVTFCVQPWKIITDTQNYTPNAFTNAQLAKVVYHGYWNTARSGYDFAVTQLMIWETLGYAPTAHTVPNYEERKTQINNSINGHDVRPSFHGQTFTLNKNEHKTITDTNNIIQQMVLFANSSNMPHSLSGNQLTIHAKNGNETTGSLTFRKIRDLSVIGASVMYTHPTSQNVVLLRLSDPIESNINIRMVNGNVQIMKTGAVFSDIEEITNDDGITYQYPIYEEVGLADSEFTIKAKGNYTDHSGNIIKSDGEVVQVTTSDNTGVARSIDLGEGTFTIEETKAPVGYNVDATIHEFTVTADGGITQLKQLNVINQKKPQTYTINKTLEENPIEGLKNSEAYKDVEFTIYANEIIHNYNQTLQFDVDAAITTFGINEDGEMITRELDPITDEVVEVPFTLDLPYGEYYTKETKTNASYVLDDTKHFFTLDADTTDEEILIAINDNEEIVNKLKEYKIIVNKTDSVTNQPIKSKDFKFEAKLYDVDGNIVETLTANADQETGTATFDIKGQVSKVEVTEIEAPKGYLLSKEVKTFAIDTESEEVLFDEDLVYSFDYVNQMMPAYAIQTGDSNNVNILMTVAFASFVVLGIYGIRRVKRHEKN